MKTAGALASIAALAMLVACSKPTERVAPSAGSSGATAASGAPGAAPPSDALGAPNPMGDPATGASADPLVRPRKPGTRILALGDTGEGNDAERANGAMMSAVCQAAGGCDAVLLAGDNFYEGGVKSVDDPQWQTKFEEPFDQPGLAKLPFYAVLGNHDYGPHSEGSKPAQIDYTTLPIGVGPHLRPSPKWNMPAAYYSARVGDVEVFAIDTMDFASTTQREEMKSKVEKSTAPWKIVFGHHPRFTSGAHWRDNQDLDKKGLGDFLQAVYCKADLYVCGHEHDREFIDRGRDAKCPNTTFIVTGAGSKIRHTRPDVPVDPKSAWFDDSKPGFALLEAIGKKLVVRFYDEHGKIDFVREIAKE